MNMCHRFSRRESSVHYSKFTWRKTIFLPSFFFPCFSFGEYLLIKHIDEAPSGSMDETVECGDRRKI